MHASCKRKIYYREKDHSNIQKFPVRALYGLVKSSVRKKETGAGHIFISTNCGTRAADAKCPRRRDFLRRGIFDIFRQRNKTTALTRERKNL